MQINKNSNCETDLIQNKLHNCEAQFFELLNDFILSLNTGNQWFIAPAAEMTLHIVCSTDKFINSFFISKNSLLTLRQDCIAKTDKASFVPSTNFNLSTIEIPHIVDLEIPQIPNQVLPKLDLNIVINKPLYKNALNLDEVSKKLHQLEQETRKKNWYHYGMNLLNKLGYSCTLIVILYGLYKFGVLSALLLFLKGIFTKVCNQICCRHCSTHSFNNVSDRNSFTPLNITYTVNSNESKKELLNIEPVSITRNRIQFS